MGIPQRPCANAREVTLNYGWLPWRFCVNDRKGVPSTEPMIPESSGANAKVVTLLIGRHTMGWRKGENGNSPALLLHGAIKIMGQTLFSVALV